MEKSDKYSIGFIWGTWSTKKKISPQREFGWKAMGGGGKQVFQSHKCYSLILWIFQLRTISHKEDIKKLNKLCYIRNSDTAT